MKDFNRVIRYMAYVLELLVLFMLQEVPGLTPAIFGVRPVLLFPAVLTIAMFEDEVPAMAFGVLGGLFCDFGLAGAMGFHGLILGVLCFFLSILIRVYFQVNLVTAVLAGLAAIGLVILAQWLLWYRLRYSGGQVALARHYLPKYFYTMLLIPLAYLFNRSLSQAVRAPEE